jgi:thiol-disulfide isomerase/thioredoxin
MIDLFIFITCMHNNNVRYLLITYFNYNSNIQNCYIKYSLNLKRISFFFILMKGRFLVMTLLLSVLLTSGCTKDYIPPDYHIGSDSTIDDFKGKPSFIYFGGTYCPHCRAGIPEIRDKLWNIYKDEANIWVNVIDKKYFDVEDIAQGFNPNLDFDQLTSTQCQYVPSFVVMDKDLNIVMQSCGTEHSIDEARAEIEKLI